MLIDILQRGMEEYNDLEMEGTIHATILNRKGKTKNRAANSSILVNTITSLAKSIHNWLVGTIGDGERHCKSTGEPRNTRQRDISFRPFINAEE